MQAKELSQVESLREKIRAFAEFQVLNPKHQKRLLAGDWKIVLGTADLAIDAGFHGLTSRMFIASCAVTHMRDILVLYKLLRQKRWKNKLR